MQERWRIEMLGWLRITRRDRVITRSRTQKAGALLAFLAYHAHRSHPRGSLIELLWPECEPEAGRNRLSVALSSLRRQLEPPGVTAGTVIQANHSTVQLNPAAFTTDVSQFEAALRQAEGRESDSERILRLERAVGLYRGELLPGYFEDWIVPERERLTGLYCQTLRELAAVCEAEGDLHQALQWARRAVGAEPLNEEAHAEMIRLLAATGQEGAAVRHYRELERLLATEADTRPSPETRALVAQICEGEIETAGVPKAVSLHQEPFSLPAAAERSSGAESAPIAPPEPLPRTPGHLPLQLTRFFGREAEIARLQELLMDGTRLLTLTGPGGSGKTRLAIAVAARLRELFGGAVWFVPLQDVADPRLVIERVHASMELPRTPHVEPRDQVIGALRRQPALLLLDNVEQLGEEGATEVQALLEQVEALTLMVTSRRSLELPGEQTFPVGPLPVPMSSEQRTVGGIDRGSPSARPTAYCSLPTLTQYPSVQLFVDRAQAVRPDFQVTERNAAAVAELCTRLEGLPLAIELAAARVGVLTPQQMLEHLEARFQLLVTRRRVSDQRHRSLWAALEWSYRLLAPELQRFFARLSMFRGGWTLEAAREVCEEPQALEYLEELRECSLVLAEEQDGAMRYRLLETLREFGAEQLSAEEQDALTRQHRAYYAAFADTANSHAPYAEAREWLRRLEGERDNFRIALQRAWEMKEAVAGLQLVERLTHLWHDCGCGAECARWCEALVALPEAGSCATTLVNARARLAGYATEQNDLATARSWHARNLELGQELGEPRFMALALTGLGTNAYYEQHWDEARRHLYEAWTLWKGLHEPHQVSECLWVLGLIADRQGSWSEADQYYTESLQVEREAGDSPELASRLHVVGRIWWERGEEVSSRALVEESVALWRQLGMRCRLTDPLNTLAHMVMQQGDYGTARRLLEEGLELAEESGSLGRIAGCLIWLGDVAISEQQYEEARLLLERSVHIWRSNQADYMLNWALSLLARAAYGQGDPAAKCIAAECLTRREIAGHAEEVAACLEGLARVGTARAAWQPAVLLYAAADAVREANNVRNPFRRRQLDEPYLSRLSASLGADAFTAAWDAGRTMSWREAIDAAFSERVAG